MEGHKNLIANNRKWAETVKKHDPDFFHNLAKVQNPEYLWIGCSDSRVPADQITGTLPGEIFVHRNIANMVVHTDMNLLAVLDYAVNHLHVKHIIVCGHYGCGGVKAALGRHDLGIINKWVRNIKDVYVINKDVIDSCATDEEKLNRLTELNVKQQVINLAKTTIIQKSWKLNQRPKIHGWVYGLEDGLIKTIYEMDNENHELDPIYEYDDI
jgi:carbonic anhydrase